MRRISAYFISLLLVLFISRGMVYAQDTIDIPLKIKVGLEVSGPAIHISDKNIMNAEGYFSVDLNEKRSVVMAAGYLDYKFSQYNYSYLNKGIFLRAGIDFNLLKPEKSLGKYWAGIGLRYGISRFSSEVPSFQDSSYWGITYSSIAKRINWGHFIEASPGVRAEIFRNFSIGWTISVRMLLYTSTGKDLKPIYFPGFGNGGNRFSTAISYFIVWNIPYKKIRVISKKEAPEEPENTGQPVNNSQSSGIRQ